MSNDPIHPPIGILITLGSLAVHIDEYLSPGGHPIDRQVIETMLQDRDLKEWLSQMDKLAFLPVKRDTPPVNTKGRRK